MSYRISPRPNEEWIAGPEFGDTVLRWTGFVAEPADIAHPWVYPEDGPSLPMFAWCEVPGHAAHRARLMAHAPPWLGLHFPAQGQEANARHLNVLVERWIAPALVWWGQQGNGSLRWLRQDPRPFRELDLAMGLHAAVLAYPDSFPARP